MRGEWAGIPMPLDGERLIIEPRYPNAEALMAIGHKPEPPHPMDGATERNKWYSMARRCDIHVINMPDGRIDWGITPGFHGLEHAMTTLGCSEAWGLEQENTALQLLANLISERQFKQYMLTGTFLESSKRSGLTYMFRRLRPTVAIVADHKRNRTRILCALCLHPIAYYARSWAGAMCPTDDVVAHLMMMRGDERRFWAKSNQHPAWMPQAGL